nr:MAG: hypothetical protein [Microviridae sp.]
MINSPLQIESIVRYEKALDMIKYLIDDSKKLISIQKLEGNLVSIWYCNAKKTEVKK